MRVFQPMKKGNYLTQVKMSEGLKTLKLLFKSLFVLANVLIVVLFVISAYSDRVSPDTILSFLIWDWFSLFYVS